MIIKAASTRARIRRGISWILTLLLLAILLVDTITANYPAISSVTKVIADIR